MHLHSKDQVTTLIVRIIYLIHLTLFSLKAGKYSQCWFLFNEVNFQSPVLTLNLPQSEQTLFRA